MTTWNFVSRRRGWTIEKVAANNGIKTLKQFCDWCAARDIEPPPDKDLKAFFTVAKPKPKPKSTGTEPPVEIPQPVKKKSTRRKKKETTQDN
jgi:hypothetical protein